MNSEPIANFRRLRTKLSEAVRHEGFASHWVDDQNLKLDDDDVYIQVRPTADIFQFDVRLLAFLPGRASPPNVSAIFQGSDHTIAANVA